MVQKQEAPTDGELKCDPTMGIETKISGKQLDLWNL